MTSCNTNIVVASVQVELGVEFCAAKLVKEVGDQLDWVLILSGELVEVPKVDTESQGPIFLLCKQDWGTCWGLG